MKRSAILSALPVVVAAMAIWWASAASFTVSPASVSLNGFGAQRFTASKPGVKWSISPQLGTIDATGLYKAPNDADDAPLPATNVSVIATSGNTSASGTVTLVPVVITKNPMICPPLIAPSTQGTRSGKVCHFSVVVSGWLGPPPAPLTWEVNGVTGGNPTVGTIVSTGPTSADYTAPLVANWRTPFNVTARITW